MINKEIYDRLEPYFIKLEQANNNFVRIPRSELNKINKIYGEITGKPLNPSNLNCNHCVLNMCKELWVMVVEYRKWYKNRYKEDLA